MLSVTEVANPNSQKGPFFNLMFELVGGCENMDYLLWAMASCNLVGRYQRFVVAYHLHLQVRNAFVPHFNITSVTSYRST